MAAKGSGGGGTKAAGAPKIDKGQLKQVRKELKRRRKQTLAVRSVARPALMAAVVLTLVARALPLLPL